MISMGESVGLGDHHHHHHQVSEKLLQTAFPEMDSVPVPPNEPHSDSAGEVGGTDKRPHVVSIGEYLGLHDSKLKDVKRVLQDDVVDYLENIFGYGHNKETLDTLKNVTGDCGNHLHAVVRAKHAKRKRDSDGVVGGSWKRQRLGSIGVEHMLPDFKFKDVKSEASLTTGDVETPSAGEGLKSSEASLITDMNLPCGTLSADESVVDRKMERIHGAAVNYLKSCLGYGRYKEVSETLNNPGYYANHLRALVRAKDAKRKRDSKGLCSSASLAGVGLTDNDVTNLRRYFKEHLAKFSNVEDWSREIKKKGAYGAYLRALIRTGGGSFDEILEAMIKEGVRLRGIAVVATETSSWEVKQLNIFLRGGSKKKSRSKGKENSGVELLLQGI